MECHHIRIPDGMSIHGYTVDGNAAQVRAGEYAVHVLEPKVPCFGDRIYRFVGADARGRDVHVARAQAPTLETWLAPGLPVDDAAHLAGREGPVACEPPSPLQT